MLREKRKRASDFVILLLALFFSLVPPPFSSPILFIDHFVYPFLPSFLSSFYPIPYPILRIILYSPFHPRPFLLRYFTILSFVFGRFLPTLFWYFILVVHIIVLLSILVVVGIELTFPNGRSLPRLNEHFDGRRAFPSAIVGYCREERMRWCPTNATNTGRFEKRVVEF